MYFVIGFCGALACLGMFGLGAAVGWNVHRLTRSGAASGEIRDADAPPAVTDERDAFRRLQSYGVEDAYGLNRQEG